MMQENGSGMVIQLYLQDMTESKKKKKTDSKVDVSDSIDHMGWIEVMWSSLTSSFTTS